MASTTPPNLSAQTTIASGDLLLVWPSGSGGPLQNITWANTKTQLSGDLATTWLRPSQNLADVSNAGTARTNLGLGTAALANVATSGNAIGLLNTHNTWGATQDIGATGANVQALRLFSTTVGSQNVFLSLDPGNGGFGVRDALIVANNNGSDAITLDFKVANAAVPATGLRINPALSLVFPGYGAGTLTTNSSGAVSASSDAKLKTVLGNYGRGLADLKNMGAPVLFRWKAEVAELEAQGKPAPSYAGWTAQAIETGVPEAVGVGPDGFKTVNDRAIIAALFNAVLELAGRVEALER